MKTIFKYKLNLGLTTIKTFQGVQWIKAKCIRGEIYLWGIVISDFMEIEKEIVIIGTGHPIPVKMGYIDTVFDDPFVWHIFETFEQ